MDVLDLLIYAELKHQWAQGAYFAQRAKAGPSLRPQIYQPKIESSRARLGAVFVEPGAIHLVFLDEVAPSGELDARYREVRQQVFGRTQDVESVEIVNGDIAFQGSASLLNLFESSIHWTSREENQGALFSNTWNHLLSARRQWYIELRGGYQDQTALAQWLEGDREAAERWVP
mgnify:CR=1 FL=1